MAYKTKKDILVRAAEIAEACDSDDAVLDMALEMRFELDWDEDAVDELLKELGF